MTDSLLDCMVPGEPPLASMVPNTDYFEMQSKNVGSIFGIWVTKPARYDDEAQREYPVVLVTDGNGSAPALASRSWLLRDDPIEPIEPFLQVCVGYTGAEAVDALRVRNRDLVPPGEPVNPILDAQIDAMVGRGAFTAEAAAPFKASLRETHADVFLNFLLDELRPAIASRYRVAPTGAGLFGYSYGGLFAAWVALHRPDAFERIGAGSPAMWTPDSMVLQIVRRLQAEQPILPDRMLHVTLCDREITTPSFYQALGRTFTQLTAMIGAGAVPGLDFSSRILPGETHASGSSAAWSSFLRTCYSASSLPR